MTLDDEPEFIIHVPSLALDVPDGQSAVPPLLVTDDVVEPDQEEELPVHVEPLPLIIQVPSPACVVPDGQLIGAPVVDVDEE